MLIIGHRGASGEKPENTIAALRAGMEAGADMLEFDVRITRDRVPVLAHDFHLYKTHHKIDFIARHNFDELIKRTSGSDHPILPLEGALKECFGKILLNIELKEYRAIGPTLDALKPYLKKKADWEMVVFSSFKPLILRKIRRKAPWASLALLHHINPLEFMAWQIPLRLSAVGFHRLHISGFALAVAKKLGLFTYAYTVNRADAAQRLAERGVDGIITDFPLRLGRELEKLRD